MRTPWNVMKLELSKWALIAAAVGSLSSGPVPTADALEPAPIPELAQWEGRMTTLGNQYCAPFTGNNGSMATLDMTRFDAERVYYQIGQYQFDVLGKDSTIWRACARAAESIYQNYVLANFGEVNAQGGLLYSQGLKKGYLDRSDPNTKAAVDSLALESPNAITQDPKLTESYMRSVEVAQLLMAFVDYMELGGSKPDRFDLFVNQALGHIDQWYAPDATTGLLLWQAQGGSHVPYHVGLTLQAIIQVYNYQQVNKLPVDARILQKVKVALDGLWNLAWVDGDSAFYHYNFSNNLGDPKHNLLIAPAYAWYYLQTGDAAYRQHADDIFAGGVGATVSNSEDFNKNYAWSFDYVAWRKAADEKYAPPAPTTPPTTPPSDPPSTTPPTDPPTTPPPGPGANGAPVCTDGKAIPSMLWPPNHKMVPIRIIGITDPDQDPLSMEMTVSQDEPVKGRGRRDLSPDMYIKNGMLYLRAERSKHGDGREYTVKVTALDGKGGTCSTIVKVKVPKKRSKVDNWKDDDDDDDDRDKKSGHRKDDHQDGKKKDRDEDGKNSKNAVKSKR